MREHIGRDHPSEGVFIFHGQPTIVFLTVCARHRERMLANVPTQKALIEAWRAANAWRVGYYLIMPDHIHLFCAPVDENYTIEKWIVFWKRLFRRACGSDAPRFQSRGFIIVFVDRKITKKNGNTFERIPLGLAWC